MRDRLYNSKHIQNYIVSLIKSGKTNGKKMFYFAEKGGNIADFDLKFAIGHANLSFTITKTKDKQFIWFGKTKYIVKLTMSDIFDFRWFTKADAGFISRSINNYLGYWPQQLNIIRAYNWNITYTFNFYY